MCCLAQASLWLRSCDHDQQQGTVLLAAAAGYEGEAAVATIAHIMREQGVSPYAATLAARYQHTALNVSPPFCTRNAHGSTKQSASAKFEAAQHLRILFKSACLPARPPIRRLQAAIVIASHISPENSLMSLLLLRSNSLFVC